jgi:hypothetical protein
VYGEEGSLMTETDTTNAQPGEMKTPKERIKKKNFDHDGFWKDLIDKFFYYLLKRVLPELYEAADKETKPRFLDKEFRDVLNTADPEIHNSPYFADYVLEVPLKKGGTEWILLHLEIQGRQGGNLVVRMYTYKCLIFAHYHREPVAIAIITHKRPPNEPTYYSHNHYGTESLYRYNSLVLLELDDDELLASDNPIDLALYAAKFALKTKKELQKFNFLHTIVELLNERGWSLEDKRDLLLFIERIVNMKDKMLITQFKEILEQENKEGKAMYIPLIMRDSAAEIEGRAKEEKAKEMAKNLLANGVSPEVIAKSAGLPLAQIQELMN